MTTQVPPSIPERIRRWSGHEGHLSSQARNPETRHDLSKPRIVPCRPAQHGHHIIGDGGAYEVTHTGGNSWALVRPSYDLTTLFAGIGAAGFASALIIGGGALGQLKRMPPGSAYAVGMSALVSIVGLLVLAFAG